MKLKKKYYHFTAAENFLSISQRGIEANEEGMIFLFENKILTAGNISMRVGDSIARNQIGLSSYDLWEVSSTGIHGTFEPDLVGELTAPYQFVLHQSLIKPTACKLIGHKKVDSVAVDSFLSASYGLTYRNNGIPPIDFDLLMKSN